MTTVQQPNISLRRPVAASSATCADSVNGVSRRILKQQTAPHTHHVQVSSSATTSCNVLGKRLSSPAGSISAPHTHTVSVVPGIGRGIRSRAASSSLPGGLPLVSNASSNTPASSSPDASSYTDSTNTINGSSNSTANTTTTTNNNGAHSTTIINATGTTTHTISLNELSRSVFASNGRVSQSPNASHQSGRGRGRVVVRGSLPTFSTSEISETNLRFTSLSFDTGTAAAAAAPVAAPVAAALTEASSSQVPLNTTATPVVATTSAAAAVTTVTPVPLSSNRSSTFSSHATVPAGRPVSVRRQSADIAPAAMAAVASAASPPEPARPVQSVQQQEQKQQPPSKSALVRSPSVDDYRLVNLGKCNAIAGAMLMDEGQKVKFALPTSVLQDIQTGNLYALIQNVTAGSQALLDDVHSRIRNILLTIEDRLSEKNTELNCSTNAADCNARSMASSANVLSTRTRVAYSRAELLSLYSCPLSSLCPAASKIINTIVEDKPIDAVSEIVSSVKTCIDE
ncbi:uncharacterized protein LOC135830150 [Sycon ciliatum]|uniref:uncharacterized protein LOC135830150 n=1 Tax=Sycon ciliatum TaxID=27933 RepID=UPI0031F65E58